VTEAFSNGNLKVDSRAWTGCDSAPNRRGIFRVGAALGRDGGHIDLPIDMQNELRDLESRGARVSHYELLGVAADADGGAIRRAYFERSKRLHPDAWYGKELGHFAELLSKWFQKLAAAYQTLSDEETRLVYDREHKAAMSSTERAAVQRRELSRAEEERRERERRQRLLHSKGFARIGAARKLFEDANELAQNGERTNAIAALKVARELDPNRKEIISRLAELEREQGKARARSALIVAQEKEEQQQFPQAAAAYAAAYQQEKSVAAAMGASRCSLQSSELPGASSWAGRAVELEPNNPDARLLLAKTFVSLGMKARARTELQNILAKHPDIKEAKALLRSL
jgi:curved DNA-binding protein CbpA